MERQRLVAKRFIQQGFINGNIGEPPTRHRLQVLQ
jgi:hypothetical protein